MGKQPYIYSEMTSYLVCLVHGVFFSINMGVFPYTYALCIIILDIDEFADEWHVVGAGEVENGGVVRRNGRREGCHAQAA